ncbi:hypothetical protein BC827DRAFT_518823 [Russula dissimulans]|nr:hypothetical protein BC827DRAFT_518823 [Russula dissimulans]
MLRSATRRDDWVLLRDTSPDGWGPPSPTAVPSAPPLTRQPSIRRPPGRSRTVDFTDFTSRRRSSGREGNHTTPGAEPDADDSAAPATSSRPSTNTTTVPPRRFFPSRRPELPWSPLPESGSASTATGSGIGTGSTATPSTRSSPTPATATTQVDGRPQRTFLSWLPSNALLSLPPPPPVDLRSPRTTPRLRRGGVRPPESLLSRPQLTMLRTESPEPLASLNPSPSAGANAGAAVEGDVPPLSTSPGPASETGIAAAPVNTPRVQPPRTVE